MAPKILAALSALVVLAATVVHAEQTINVIFSSGEFSTLSGPSGLGNEASHSAGFALIDQDGKTIYEAPYPDDYRPCFSDGRTFSVDMPCFAEPRTFYCKSDFGGKPEHCSVAGAAGNLIMEADGDSETTFIGIAIAIDGKCAVQFSFLPGEVCGADQQDVTIM